MRKLVLLPILIILVAGCVQQEPQKEPTSESVQSNTVEIIDFSFDPASLKVIRGTTVTWTNKDSVSHTIRIADVESPSISQGQSWSYKFDEIGTFDYICGIHPYMKGNVIVEPKEAITE